MATIWCPDLLRLILAIAPRSVAAVTSITRFVVGEKMSAADQTRKENVLVLVFIVVLVIIEPFVGAVGGRI